MKWILVLETSEADREYLGRVIDRLGYKFFCAPSGAEALRLMEQSLPDAFLVGENVPDYDPLDLGRTVKNNRMLADAPLLLMTSNYDTSHRQKAGQAGYNEIVNRPMSIREFYTSLEMCLSNNRRMHIRAPMAFPVNVTMDKGVVPMVTHNFGEGGMYVQTEDPPPGSTELDVQFNLPGLKNMFDLSSQVVHAQARETDEMPAGMGLKFLDIKPAIGMVLKIFMENFLVKRVASTA
jgi:uncharacterized protein (TIGR02266 family)